MNQIDALKAQIQELELQAAEVDEAADDYYEQLYKLLSVAYFHCKDIKELQAPDVPLTVDKALEARLCDSEEALAEAKKVIIEQQSKLVKILEIIT